MFHNRKSNNHINHIHERALTIVYQDHNSMSEEFLAKDRSFKIHDRNLQRLLTEIFKVKMKLAPEIMNEVFDIIELTLFCWGFFCLFLFCLFLSSPYFF